MHIMIWVISVTSLVLSSSSSSSSSGSGNNNLKYHFYMTISCAYSSSLLPQPQSPPSLPPL